jgi:lysophospholipase L1-like esterase
MNPWIAAALAISLIAPPKTGKHEQWDAEIAKLETKAAKRQDLVGGVVFTGSSSIKNWKTLTKDFNGIPVINMGFGGSELADAVYYVDRLVLQYKPRVVVVYSGENDINAGVPVRRVLEDLKQFIALVHKDDPATRIIVVSLKPSPVREKHLGKVREYNRLASDYTKGIRNVEFADVFTPMLTPDGKFRDELYVSDRLHMTSAGYAIWSDILIPMVRTAVLQR